MERLRDDQWEPAADLFPGGREGPRGPRRVQEKHAAGHAGSHVPQAGWKSLTDGVVPDCAVLKA